MLLELTGWVTYQLFRLPADSRWGEIVHFFLYDSLKILFLLYFMIMVIGFLRTFLPPQKIKEWLTRSGAGAHFLAALFGAITPFCSCSSIPFFIGFVQAGIPLGVALSFLITSPLINEYLVVLMLGFFGWKITLAYIVSGMTIGIVGGLIISRLKLGKELEPDLFASEGSILGGEEYESWRSRLVYGVTEANDIIAKVWHWILIGVGLGALIHNFLPREVLESLIGQAGVLSVPLATALGVPMYAGCAAIVPVAVVLFQKGLPLGTAMAFMMATAALSLPEAIMLRRAMKLKLILIFFGITAAAIVATGYLLNFIQPLLT